jgi:predicted CXXCH cytochrome family protein
MALAVMLAAVGVPAMAFHDGGVAECVGCHSMHSPNPAGVSLLIGESAASTCLSCHEEAGLTTPRSYHISTNAADMPAGSPPIQLTPGGDFGWLKKTYNWTPPWFGAEPQTEEGHTHGHNIIANDFGYVVDPENMTSPGGSFPSGQLGCQSCHDPHGTYRRLPDNSISTMGGPIVGSGSYNDSGVPAAGEALGAYRLLAGNGYQQDGVTFGGNPAAVAPETYNRSENVTQTRVAYGLGTTNGYEAWGDWCATCHGSMHSSGNYVHPTDASLSGTATTYNSYVRSGDLTGMPTSSFLSLVPFIENEDDYAMLAGNSQNDDSVLDGPVGADQVSCLSCHRAHASGFEYALRWNPESEFLTYNGVWPGTDNGTPVQFARGRTEAEMQQAYYDREATVFATYQRQLCNKCHAKD